MSHALGVLLMRPGHLGVALALGYGGSAAAQCILNRI